MTKNETKARELLAQLSLDNHDMQTWIVLLARAVTFLLARYIDKA